ncbi:MULTISPECIES: portal protein [Burkholderia]|uniref:portal protein n=1 Tax=Burkholderia TaxID=32008 RepID=UPI000B7AC46A|nr:MULTISPECIES: portal protein [Burkholderia]MBY4725711.1 head-tail connector protein [Burkholderia contaminans]MCI3969249.1 portal protein [Burkholderia sp. HI4860]OXI98481.1 phage tail protein [Burkholderia sp. AU33647]
MSDAESSLRGRYEKLSGDRYAYLERGRDCAKLTIPTLLPPEGATSATRFRTPYQSLGARGVNNLAAKLLLALLPPNSPFFRLVIDDVMLVKLTGREGMRAQVENALSSMERSVMTNIETSGLRTSAFEGLKLLLVTGNVLFFLAPEGGMKVFRLDRYVVKRDPMGNVLEILTKENVSPMELPDNIRAAVMANKSNDDNCDTVEVYTCIKRTETNWKVWQEANGIDLPESHGSYPLGKSPWIPLRFIAVDGEDYGRGFVEEYLGDLQSLNALRKAIVQGSAAAAKVLFLVKPNSTTKLRVLTESESGAVKEGNAEDVTVLQMQKQADFAVAKQTCDTITGELSFAFLLNTAIQRAGERVTAEEIRYMANELESSLGGVYSTLSQEFQLPLVQRVMFQMERQGKLPALPQGTVKPAITTGIEAIGRGNDLTKLQQFMTSLESLGPQVAPTYVNMGDLIKRTGASLGIDMNGLIKTDEQIAAAEQQAQMQNMLQQLGPNAVNQLGGLMKQNMQGQQAAAPTQGQ